MRRYNIIFASLAILTLAGCVKELSQIEDTIPEEGRKATFTFTPQILGLEDQVGTKVMDSNPIIHNIYFAVFDGTGYKLSEYAEAVPNSLADVNGTKFKYSVELTITKEPRILHIIANAPKRLIYGSESEVIGALTTSIDADDPQGVDSGEWKEAYWTRISLDHGVWEAPDEDKHGLEGSDSYELQKSRFTEVIDKLNSAQLIRNFSRIIVDEKADNFKMTGFWLTNYPDRGSIAPYNRSTRQFQVNFADFTRQEDMLQIANYKGYTPASAQIRNILDLNSAEVDDAMVPANLQSDGATRMGTSFCYEREQPRSNPLYIIMKGRYGSDPEDSYYKLDLRDEQGSYFPVLRNFSYSVHIHGVRCSGAATMEDAFAGPPSNGDVSTSLEMQELTNISNGRSQMFVSETSEIIVGTAPVTLRYKYIPRMTTGTQANGTVADDNGYVTITSTSGITGNAFDSYSVAPTDESDGYRVITLYPHEPDAIIKTQTITITGKYKTDRTDSEGNPIYESITRSIEYKLRERLNMTVECAPKDIPLGAGETVTVRIGLEEGLPSSIFSLNLNLEAAGLSLTTDNLAPLPVQSGPSTVYDSDGNLIDKPAYHFVKTITWNDYLSTPTVGGYKYFDCIFKTNKDFTADERETVYVNNRYFNQNSDSFKAYSEKRFLSGAFESVAKVGNKVAFNFTTQIVPEDGKVRIGVKSFEPWPDAGDALTMTHIGMNADGLDEYEVSVSSTSGKIYLNPYTAGLGYVKLYAKEFVSIDAETIVNDASASVSVWADIAGTNSTAHDWIRLTGDDVTGAGQPVIGQKTTLTVYVGGNHTASDVRIDGQTATRLTSGTGRSISLGSPAETFNAYYIEYRPEIGDSRTDRIKVTVGGTLCATFEVGVWGMEVSEEPLRNATHEIYQAGHYYIFVNKGQTDYHLYATEASANISGRLTADNPYDYNSLFGFDNTSNSVKVRVPSKKGFVAGAKSSRNSAVTLSISDGGTAYSLAYSNSGIQLRNNYNNTNYNWYQSNGTAAMILPTYNNRSNVSTFNVYSVRLLRP